MKFITTLFALTAFVAAQDNNLDAQVGITAIQNGTMPTYPMPTGEQTNSNGSQNQTKEYPLPPSQSGNSTSSGQNGGNKDGNSSSGNQNGSQGGNQGQKSYPIPIPTQEQGGNNQAMMDEFQKFLQSPMIKKFMEYMKSAQQNKY